MKMRSDAIREPRSRQDILSSFAFRKAVYHCSNGNTHSSSSLCLLQIKQGTFAKRYTSLYRSTSALGHVPPSAPSKCCHYKLSPLWKYRQSCTCRLQLTSALVDDPPLIAYYVILAKAGWQGPDFEWVRSHSRWHLIEDIPGFEPGEVALAASKGRLDSIVWTRKGQRYAIKNGAYSEFLIYSRRKVYQQAIAVAIAEARIQDARDAMSLARVV